MYKFSENGVEILTIMHIFPPGTDIGGRIDMRKKSRACVCLVAKNAKNHKML